MFRLLLTCSQNKKRAVRLSFVKASINKEILAHVPVRILDITIAYEYALVIEYIKDACKLTG